MLGVSWCVASHLLPLLPLQVQLGTSHLLPLLPLQVQLGTSHLLPLLPPQVQLGTSHLLPLLPPQVQLGTDHLDLLLLHYSSCWGSLCNELPAQAGAQPPAPKIEVRAIALRGGSGRHLGRVPGATAAAGDPGGSWGCPPGGP
jgi:hypothetical protein